MFDNIFSGLRDLAAFLTSFFFGNGEDVYRYEPYNDISQFLLGAEPGEGTDYGGDVYQRPDIELAGRSGIPNMEDQREDQREDLRASRVHIFGDAPSQL